jgi:predicted glycoside hydrolase/deacetylase ChbG (UPF0249 family)
VPAVRRHGRRGAVEAECRAQIETALAAGLDVTHLDTHMGAAAAPEFADIYVRLGREYRLPVLLPRSSSSYVSVLDMGPLDLGYYDELIATLSAQEVPLIDRFAMGLAMRQHSCEQAYRLMVEQAEPGVTYLSLHCSTPGEVERLHPNDAAWRIAEYQLFREPAFADWVGGQDVRLIGFRAIREAYHGALGSI